MALQNATPDKLIVLQVIEGEHNPLRPYTTIWWYFKFQLISSSYVETNTFSNCDHLFEILFGKYIKCREIISL